MQMKDTRRRQALGPDCLIFKTDSRSQFIGETKCLNDYAISFAESGAGLVKGLKIVLAGTQSITYNVCTLSQQVAV